MKQTHLFFSIVFTVLLCAGFSLGQTLYLNENFDYGSTSDPQLVNVTSNWVRHSGADGPQYVYPGLSYSGYSSSGIGGAIGFTNGSSGTNDGDVNRSLATSISATQTFYVSFLLNLTSAKSSADYFFLLGPTTLGSTFRSRLFAQSGTTGYLLGLSKSTETKTLTSTELNFNQTYLIVIEYDFNTAAADDDQITLFVYDSGLPASEPSSPLLTIGPIGSGNSGDPTDIGTVAIRQGSNTPTGFIDGIRVSDSWELAPLPVELSSFTITKSKTGAKLSWQTATEINNYGFDIERQVINNKAGKWNKIGFVKGAGTSNSPKNYSFIDESAAAGNYFYRLKQIDTDGKYKYSKSVEVVYKIPSSFTLEQNYPNPFNPSTTIKFSFDKNTRAALTIYNALGMQVANLFEGNVEAGKEYNVTFNASNLSSGVYYYKLSGESRTAVKKMLLLK